jgi:class 3 adenylate cyclase
VSETVLAKSKSSDQKNSIELAHVLFLDIVGYTRLPIDLQTKTLEQLHELLRGTEDFVRSQESQRLLRLPSGDGMALVFFGDVEAPARCAVELSKALRSHPEIKLRMGVHSGPVDPIVDVNDVPIVTGAGINTAQRVMDCGDAGHILLSKRVADDLSQYSRWKENLHDLGEVTVKHGERIHIVNLYTDEAGNPERPAKFKSVKKPFPSVAVAAVLMVIVVTGALLLWAPWKRNVIVPTPATRTLMYSLTVQKMVKVPNTSEYKPQGDPFPSTGNEFYGNGWEFRINITPEQPGSLYLLNEGPGENGAVVYNVLFPTPANNNSVAQLAAGQDMKTGRYFFNKFNGPPEIVWIIWSTQPIAELDAFFKAAANSKLQITDPAQISTVRDLIDKYGSPKPDVQTDKSKAQTTVKGNGDVLVSKMELEHKEY